MFNQIKGWLVCESQEERILVGLPSAAFRLPDACPSSCPVSTDCPVSDWAVVAILYLNALITRR